MNHKIQTKGWHGNGYGKHNANYFSGCESLPYSPMGFSETKAKTGKKKTACSHQTVIN